MISFAQILSKSSVGATDEDVAIACIISPYATIVPGGENNRDFLYFTS